MKIKMSFVLLVLMLVSCGPSTQIVGSWTKQDLPTEKTYNKVFITAMSSNTTVQNTLENSLASAARERGIEAATSGQSFKRSFTLDTQPSKEEILETVNLQSADAIFTVNILDQKTETRYVPGSTTYYSPMTYGYYGSFNTYYNSMYPMAYDPGYYTEDKVYYLESNLYDVETEELIWSAQSKTVNPSNIESFSQGYTRAMIQELVKDGVLKK